MKLLVQKFGGTSVATRESRELVCEKIRMAQKEGWSVVAVISAMGRKGEPYATDTLLELFSDGKPLPCSREQDAIYACGEMISGALIANELQAKRVRCVFLNGEQAGIITNARYSDADILDIRRDAILGWLKKGYVVLVAGGQGATEQGDFTSIGRGGGDTTACAIGYYLYAEEVRIYTDVDGIFTADPRIVKRAYPITDMDYEQCLRMARCGAKVIHPKAAAYSQMGGRNVLSVRSTFTDEPGTRIGTYESGCVGVTALRNQRYLRCEASEKSLWYPYLKQADILVEDGGFWHGIWRADRADSLKLPEEAVIRDVIFAIGSRGAKLPEKAECNWPLAEEKFKTDELCMAVIVKPEHYAELINQIHDDLCITNAD